MSRYDYWYERMNQAAAELLTDDTPEGQTLLQVLIDTGVSGEELISAIETAEQYLERKKA